MKTPEEIDAVWDGVTALLDAGREAEAVDECRRAIHAGEHVGVAGEARKKSTPVLARILLHLKKEGKWSPRRPVVKA